MRKLSKRGGGAAFPAATFTIRPVVGNYALSVLAIIQKRLFLNGRADLYRGGTEGNGSIQIMWRPQIAHWHTVALCGGAGEVIGTIH